MIVVDASAVLELLLATPLAAAVDARLFRSDEPLGAPHLIDVEVAQILRRYRAAGDLDEPRALAALEDLVDLPLNRYPHDVLLPRIWSLRANLTAYDAAYVALAEALDGVLVTCDARLARAPGSRARIEVIRGR